MTLSSTACTPCAVRGVISSLRYRRSRLQSAREEMEDELLDARTFALAIAGNVEDLDFVRRESVGKELVLIVRRGKCDHEARLSKIVAKALGE